IEQSYTTQTEGAGTLSTDAANNLLIGTDSLWFLKGLVDDVRIYNYVRTTGQIQQDYNAGLSTHFK
ncbi:MAG: hypothetical protein UV98_C0002G0001, partial [Parcubacteria group bacterium GW2011_GWB1_43_6]